MKEHKLENVTIEMTTDEALTIKQALAWYRETYLPNHQLWSQEEDETCIKCFGKTASQKNEEWRRTVAKEILKMEDVLWIAYTGYPFK